MVSKFIKRGTNKENVWERGNIGQFWKGTREQRPPFPTPPPPPRPLKVVLLARALFNSDIVFKMAFKQ